MTPTPRRFVELCVCEICRRTFRAPPGLAAAHSPRCPQCAAAMPRDASDAELIAWAADETECERGRRLKAIRAGQVPPPRRLHDGRYLLYCKECGRAFVAIRKCARFCETCRAERQRAASRLRRGAQRAQVASRGP